MIRCSMILPLILLPVFANGQKWNALPGPHGGRVNDLTSDQRAPWWVYAATPQGVRLTRDEGITWHTLTGKGLGYRSIERILAVMGNNLLAAASDGSVFRSADFGASWKQSFRHGESARVTAFARTENSVFMSTAGGIAPGVYISTDSGATWTLSGLAGIDAHGVACDERIGRVFAATSTGVYVSSDEASSWLLLQNGIPPEIKAFSSICVASNGGLFVGAPQRSDADGTYPGGIFSSDDNGATWNRCNAGIGFPDIRHLVAAPWGTLFAVQGRGTGYLYRSSDSGKTWSPTGVHNITTPAGMAFDPPYAYVTSNFGVFVSSNDGLTWEARNAGIDAVDASDLLLAGDTIFAATLGSGVFMSKDAGLSWVPRNSGMIDYRISVLLRAENGALIAGSSPGLCYISSDNGENWTPLVTRLFELDIRAALRSGGGRLFLSGMLTSTGAPRRSFAGILRSMNDGATWALCTDSLAPFDVRCLAAASDGTLYAGGGDGLWSSRDNGTTWEKDELAPDADYDALHFDAMTDRLCAATNQGLFLYTAGSGAWLRADSIGSTPGRTAVSAICGALLYTEPGQGLSRSVNDGSSWTRYRPFSGRDVRSLHPLLDSGTVLAATSGGVLMSPGSLAGLPNHPPDPIAPDSASPADQPVILEWTGDAGCSPALDRVQLSSDTSFKKIIFDSSGIADRRAVLPLLAQGVRYFWRACAMTPAGAGPWSPAWTFETKPDSPPPPALWYPSDKETNIPPITRISWYRPEGAFRYRIQVDTTGVFKEPLIDTIVIKEYLGVEKLNLGSTFFWRVSAGNAIGFSDWSETWSFTVTPTPPPGKVILLEPADGAEGVPVDVPLAWKAEERTEWYFIEATDDTTKREPVVIGISIDTLHTLTDLEGWTNWYWRVSARNTAGDGPWSERRRFITGEGELRSPKLLSPSDRQYVGTLQPTLRWKPVDGATSYRVRVLNNPDQTVPVLDSAGITATVLTTPPLPRGKISFYWNVEACRDGYGSGKSVTAAFDVLLRGPMPMSPYDGATIFTIDTLLEWAGHPDALQYRLQLSTQSTFGTEHTFDTLLTASRYRARGLLMESTYWWRVSAFNSISEGPFGLSQYFRTTHSTGIEQAPHTTPLLLTATPNPVHDFTLLRFELPEAGRVRLNIYDALGRRAATPADAMYDAGAHAVVWSPSGLPPGIYLCVLTAAAGRTVAAVSVLGD